MINWIKVGDRLPTNADRYYQGQPDSPYISCLVWICNPEYMRSGVCDIIRWDSENKCWHRPDMNKWFYDAPYELTHFCDNINAPEKEWKGVLHLSDGDLPS